MTRPRSPDILARAGRSRESLHTAPRRAGCSAGWWRKYEGGEDMKGTAGKASVVVAAMLSLLMAASTGFAAETIKVGVLLPLTGSQAKFGEIEKRSFEMGAREINAR